MNINMEFARAIDFLIALNVNRQCAFGAQESFISKKHWAKEYATVRCNIGRQIGKTSYIKSRASYGDLIIVGKYALKKEMMHPIPSANVITHADLDIVKFDWPRYHRIYIDEPGNLNLDLVYDIFARDTRQLFIILGS